MKEEKTLFNLGKLDLASAFMMWSALMAVVFTVMWPLFCGSYSAIKVEPNKVQSINVPMQAEVVIRAETTEARVKLGSNEKK